MLPRLGARVAPLLCLLAAACATGPRSEELQRFYPDSDQLQARTSRLLLEDGSAQRHGVCEEWYPDGQLRSRGAFTQDLADGPWQQWYANGTPACEGSYSAGRRVGQWSLWNEKGVLLERTHWSNGKLHGVACAWDADGQLVWQGSFVRGQRDGTWTAFHPNGQERVRGQYDAGVPRARWTAWHADGTRLAEGKYTDGAPDGTWVCWSAQGEQLLALTQRAGRALDGVARAGFIWDAEATAVPDPFDLAKVFSLLPSDRVPDLGPVALLPAPRARPGAENVGVGAGAALAPKAPPPAVRTAAPPSGSGLH